MILMTKKIAECLNPSLSQLCQHAMILESLTLRIAPYLPPNCQNHCRVIAFQRGCLILQIQDATLATTLRYALPELRDRLRHEAQLY